MPSYNYDIYIEDKFVGIVFEEELAFAFAHAIWERYSREDTLRVTIRKREKGVRLETSEPIKMESEGRSSGSGLIPRK